MCVVTVALWLCITLADWMVVNTASSKKAITLGHMTDTRFTFTKIGKSFFATMLKKNGFGVQKAF